MTRFIFTFRWMPLLAIFLLAGIGTCSAQDREEKTLLEKHRFVNTGSWGGYRLQMGTIADQPASISGFNLVGEHNQKFLLGYNFNWVSNDLPYTFESTTRNLRFNWHSLQLGYILAAHRMIHPVVNLDLGIGRTKLKNVGKDRIFVASPSVGIEANFYRWCHVSLEGGYRAVTGSSMANLRNADLSGAFAMLTFKFGWSDPKGIDD